jgi:hypothetical protein
LGACVALADRGMTRRMFVGALGAVPAFCKDAAPIRTVEVFPVNYPVTAYFKFLPKPERPAVFVKITCEDTDGELLGGRR